MDVLTAVHVSAHACTHARTHAPLDALDIGRSRGRSRCWPGEPNFENGKLVCPVSTFIRSPSAFLPSFRARASFMGSYMYVCTRVADWTRKEERGLGNRGATRRSLFRTGVQSVSSHWTYDTSHSYSLFFATVGRSVLARTRNTATRSDFSRACRKASEMVKCARVKISEISRCLA